MRLKANTVYNNKELAEWFEIKESTFKSSKKRRLEELKEYVVTEPSDIREWVKKIVPTYQPKEE